MGRKVYPSDISRQQFEVIRPMLEGTKHRTAPRKLDLYDVFLRGPVLAKKRMYLARDSGQFPWLEYRALLLRSLDSHEVGWIELVRASVKKIWSGARVSRMGAQKRRAFAFSTHKA